MQETNRIELKSELTSEVDIEREVVAFLNATGGCIYIGITDEGVAIGVNDTDDCMLRLKDRIKNNVQPSAMGLFDISVEKMEGKDVVKLIVAGGSEKPYYKAKYGMTSKGAFVRVGTASEPMPQSQIDKLFATRTRHSLGRIVSIRQDLSFEQLRIYYDEHSKRLTDNFRRTLELQTEDGKYNYVAYLLADENGNSMKVAKYSSLDRCDLIENNEYGYCSLIKATKSILQKLDIENRVSARITPMERIEKPLWNKVALREAVINAIVHNDYTFEVPPKFEIFPDRLEITSMGGLPVGMSKEEFFGGISIPRNKELMRIYRDVELVESLGSGIPRVLQTYGPDCFHFTENFTRIIFPADPEVVRMLQEEDNYQGKGEDYQENCQENSEKPDEVSEKMSEKNSPTLQKSLQKTDSGLQKSLQKLLEENPYISTTKVAELLGVSRQTIAVQIAKLKAQGLLHRVGPDKGGHWEVVNTKGS